jgi:hypothetical protein
MVANPVDPLAPGQPTAAVSAAEDDAEALLQVLSEEPPGQEPPPPSGGETIQFVAGTPRAGSVIEGFDPGVDKLSFDSFGPGATLAHEVGGAPDEYRITSADGSFDTFVVSGVHNLSAADFAWDDQNTTPPPGDEPGDEPGDVPGDGPGDEPGDGGGVRMRGHPPPSLHHARRLRRRGLRQGNRPDELRRLWAGRDRRARSRWRA